MHVILEALAKDMEFTGDTERDMRLFLELHGCLQTVDHCFDVAQEAQRIAHLYGADPQAALLSGYLHDISAVIPNHERIAVSRSLGLEVLPEEEAFPMIIHQKLSRVIAEELFGIRNLNVLSAIECHTTLKSGASLMDKILFVADKLAWDQPGVPPYREAMLNQLDVSLDDAAFAYIHHLWQQRERLKVVHPWLKAAYDDLAHQCKASGSLESFNL